MPHDHHLAFLILFICLCILGFAGIRHYTRKSFFVPDVWILIAGIFYGFLAQENGAYSALPKINLNPDIIFLVFLPLLIFSSGRKMDFEVLKNDSIAIGWLALPGVVATMFLIGYPVAYILGIPLKDALLFGAALAATDPLAVSAVFDRFPVGEKLKTVIEGESLFNDGVTVVLFSVMVGIVFKGDPMGYTGGFFHFIWSVAAAFPFGMIMGWIAAKILCEWDEKGAFYEVSLSLILAYLTFILGEQYLHLSGVVAVIGAAVMFVKIRYKDRARKKNHSALFSTFWNFFAQLGNSFLFFILGAATGNHVFNLDWWQVLAIVAAVAISRPVVVYAVGIILKLFKKKSMPFTWQTVITLGGLRGAISAALVLMIPESYVHREAFVCLAFVCIIFSMVGMPVGMQTYLKKTKL